MRKALPIISLILLALLLIYSGCKVRKNPLKMEIDQGGIFGTMYEFSTLDNLLDDPVGRKVRVYLPPNFLEDSTYSYPVLFLLHGFKEQGWAFQHLYNIKTVADEMIYSGEIQPMVIVMPNGASRFGGSFFTNSVTPDGNSFAGKYEDYITQELFDMVLYNYGQWMRGIRYITTDMDSLVTRDSTLYDSTCLEDTIPVSSYYRRSGGAEIFSCIWHCGVRNDWGNCYCRFKTDPPLAFFWTHPSYGPMYV